MVIQVAVSQMRGCIWVCAEFVSALLHGGSVARAEQRRTWAHPSM